MAPLKQSHGTKREKRPLINLCLMALCLSPSSVEASLGFLTSKSRSPSLYAGPVMTVPFGHSVSPDAPVLIERHPSPNQATCDCLPRDTRTSVPQGLRDPEKSTSHNSANLVRAFSKVQKSLTANRILPGVSSKTLGYARPSKAHNRPQKKAMLLALSIGPLPELHRNAMCMLR